MVHFIKKNLKEHIFAQKNPRLVIFNITQKKRQNFSCVSAFDGEYNKLVQKVTYYSYLCAVVNCIS
jgi:hypothetical protein